MGNCVSKGNTAAHRSTIQLTGGGADAAPKTSPRAFSVVADTYDLSLETLHFTIQNTWKTKEVEMVHVKENEHIVLMRVGDVYYAVDIIKLTAKNKFQASVSIK